MIFDEQVSRKPNRYPFTDDMIASMWHGHWTPDEFSFQSDVQNFKVDMTDQERLTVTNTLSAIGQIEIAVKRFWSKLGDNLPHPGLSDLGLTMAGVEVIHNVAYERLLRALQLEGVFEENLKLDIIKGRVSYLRKYNEINYADRKKQYLYALILFTLFVENVSLFSQFYIILWFNRFRNVLKDTAQQVNYTKNEETIHALAGIKIVNTIRDEYPQLFDDGLAAKVAGEAVEAFRCESKIVDWMLGGYEGDGLSGDILKEYIKDRINQSIIAIGFDPVFAVDAELIAKTEWMNEEMMANNMADFFHKRPVEYSKGGTAFDEESIFGDLNVALA